MPAVPSWPWRARASGEPVGDLNAWSILHPRKILMTTAAIDAFRATAAARGVRAADGAPVAAGGRKRTAKKAAARPARGASRPKAAAKSAASTKKGK